MNPGYSIAHYRIIAKLGEGGMGEVWRATDTKLGRDVAIKILPDSFALDSDRLARFTREAQVLASLNHPNIAAIYGVEERALVMELVEGATLAERIGKSAMPLDEALLVAQQIADAIVYAHERGVIHRDLKPANIKITPDGRVKVLDFGLAKALASEPAAADPASSPTLTMRATVAGVIMGTAAYMSPEQARGMAADKRADIWSFGVVLFEMLIGEPVFHGETVSDTLAAVLKTDPNWSLLPPETPSAIRRLLRRCLQRDRKRRLCDVGDARLEIEEALAGGSAEPVTKHVASGTSRWWIVAAAVLALAFLALWAVHFRGSSAPPHTVKSSLLPPGKSTFDSIVVSPDGRRLAFIATESGVSRLWVRPLDALTAQPLAGTEGVSLNAPFWSPDSRYIAFFADDKLKKIEASGGPAQTLCEAAGGRSGAWNRDGVILFTSLTGMRRVPAEGGEARPVAVAREFFGRWPAFLPDGRRYLCTTREGIFAASLDSQEVTRLLGDASSAAYAVAESGGLLLFWRGGSLMAQQFDSGKLRLSGGPFPIAENVGFSQTSLRAQFSVSENGVLVYDSSGIAEMSQLLWFDRTGKRLGTVGEAGHNVRPSLSPDEKSVAVDRADSQARSYNIWLIELARGIPTRFTFGSKNDSAPVWSPDGNRVVFTSNRDGIYDLYTKVASGGGKDELLLKSPNQKYPSDWSPDGRYLIYHEMDPKTKWDIKTLPNPGGAEQKPFAFLQTEFNEWHGTFSPDGKWIAYASDESGRYEIYVQPFPASGAKWQISKGGGTLPKWRRDGKELFYLGSDNKMTAAEVTPGATFRVGLPQPLFEARLAEPQFSRYTVSRDGQRFLIPTAQGEAGSAPATLIINWTAAMKR